MHNEHDSIGGRVTTYGLDRLTLEQLLYKAQELRGSRGGAAEFARYFGPSDFLELVEELRAADSPPGVAAAVYHEGVSPEG